MSLISSIIGSRASSDAADAQADAARASNETARYIYDDTRNRGQFREDMGNQALAQLGGMYGLGPNARSQITAGAPPSNGLSQSAPQTNFSFGGNGQVLRSEFGGNPITTGREGGGGFLSGVKNAAVPDGGKAPYMSGPQPSVPAQQEPQSQDGPFSAFYNSPDYQLAFNEGTQALEGSAAARGGLLSGATGRALTEYGQDRATSTFGNYRNSINNIAGLGQQAASATSQAGQNYSSAFGQNQQMIGAANANNAQQQGQIWGGFAGNVGASLLGGFGV